MTERRRVLSIAGSDPSGGAGIQADLKTFSAFGVYGMAAITSLTAQNTRGVTAVHGIPDVFVADQIAAVLDDVAVDAIKVGMLHRAEVVASVVEELEMCPRVPTVVDPVMVSTSGERLLDVEGASALLSDLLPLATVVTPNRDEAGGLTDMDVVTVADAHRAAAALLDTGVLAVIVTGVPDGEESVDVLVTREGVEQLRAPLLDVGATHGTGCTFSAALASGLALGRSVASAARMAKGYVHRAILEARPVGGGGLPLDHLVPAEDPPS